MIVQDVHCLHIVHIKGGTGFEVDKPLKRKLHVLGGNRRAVGEDCLVRQMEHIMHLLAVNIPGLGKQWHDLIVGVQSHQGFIGGSKINLTCVAEGACRIEGVQVHVAGNNQWLVLGGGCVTER
jgi:hypothetical protein